MKLYRHVAHETNITHLYQTRSFYFNPSMMFDPSKSGFYLDDPYVDMASGFEFWGVGAVVYAEMLWGDK